MPPRIALPMLLLSLGGCAQAISSACPPVVAYDGATLERAAGETERLPADSVLPRLLADYAVMRQQARACAGP